MTAPTPDTTGEVALGPLKIFFPDASFATFWFPHDLAGLFGLEYNRDATIALKAALAGRKGFQLEHEADAVTVHARAVDAMVEVLKAVGSLSVVKPAWSAEAFEQASAAMRAWKRPKPVRYEVGVVAAVPLEAIAQGSGRALRYGAVQVASFYPDGPKTRRGSRIPLLFIFDLAAPSLEALTRELEAGEGRALGCILEGATELVSGKWQIFGSRPVAEGTAATMLKRQSESGSMGGSVEWLIACYASLIAWDLRSLEGLKLLPGVEPPTHHRYLRELLEARLLAAFGRIPDPVREGPAVLHIHIAYPGKGPPLDADKAHRLAALLEATVPGAARVTRTVHWEGSTLEVPVVIKVFVGGAEGFFDVILPTTDAAVALPAVDQALARTRLTNDALVDCYPSVSLEGLIFVDRMPHQER